MWTSSIEAKVPDFIKAVEPLNFRGLKKERYAYAKKTKNYNNFMPARSEAGYYWIEGKGEVLTANTVVDFDKLDTTDQEIIRLNRHKIPLASLQPLNECPVTAPVTPRNILPNAFTLQCDMATILAN